MCFHSTGKVGCIPSTSLKSKSHMQRSNILMTAATRLLNLRLRGEMEIPLIEKG